MNEINSLEDLLAWKEEVIGNPELDRGEAIRRSKKFYVKQKTRKLKIAINNFYRDFPQLRWINFQPKIEKIEIDFDDSNPKKFQVHSKDRIVALIDKSEIELELIDNWGCWLITALKINSMVKFSYLTKRREKKENLLQIAQIIEQARISEKE